MISLRLPSENKTLQTFVGGYFILPSIFRNILNVIKDLSDTVRYTFVFRKDILCKVSYVLLYSTFTHLIYIRKSQVNLILLLILLLNKGSVRLF